MRSTASASAHSGASPCASGILAQEDAVVRLSAPETAMDALVKALARYPIADLVSESADLEEIFLNLYREAGAER